MLFWEASNVPWATKSFNAFVREILVFPMLTRGALFILRHLRSRQLKVVGS